MADVTYPIVDEIDSITVAGEDGYNPSNHNVVGLIGAPMYFRSLIQELLPQGSDGIHVVFDNSCASPFTYEIDGPVSKYLGVGDLHQKAYDDMGHDTKLYDLAGSQKTALYTGARADRDFCPMTLRIYPSDVMKASFTSKNPKIFTVAVIFIFAFTTLVFFLYDAMVERRQKKVMRTAVRSSAIVSSLFPSSVRDRLDPEAQKAKLDALVPETAQRKLQSFLRASKNSSDMSCQKTSFSGAPIAELYSETTVLFADIAGFTSWSSTRQPSQVFTLLETVYAGFDSIARQRGVFKVETIGDCYVAVVGLPTPRRRHAVVAAKFANDCRSNFRQVTAELEKALGPVSAAKSLLLLL
jgi:Adenylate and Guanylate cyclase catalytic domain